MEVQGAGSVERAYRGPGSVIDITPRYFEAMGIPLLQGRAFNDQDRGNSERVIILSERAARFLFPGRSPIGGQVRHNTNGMADPWSRVVGVVGNVRYKADETSEGMEMYYPSAQWEFESAYVAIRFQGSPAGFENAVRQAVASVDAETGIDEMKTMDALMNETLWQQRSWGFVLAGFAATTLLLAAVGLYGVMAYSVSLRRTEIGIRAALGATPGTIFGDVTREGVYLAAAGAAIGLVCRAGSDPAAADHALRRAARRSGHVPARRAGADRGGGGRVGVAGHARREHGSGQDTAELNAPIDCLYVVI